ncbi:MAG TPA: apolipoprotein N-acyltransferase [Sedimentisphaerales bacterium]|nr:apolipoprotein N-acyltransferase [Sedimentisphaerales bacterium]
MLTAIQPPFGWAALAWVAMVPFILISSSPIKTRHLVIIAYVVSACYWLGNLYWIAPVTTAGWLAFCLYTALLWPLLLLLLRYCANRGIPFLLAVPVLVVVVENLQGLFLGGFFWRFLAHSQYANISLIQIADISGAAGLSFLIAMVNALIAELIIAAAQKRIFKVAPLLKTACVAAAVLAAVAYGRWRIGQTDEFIEPGPTVAAVQSNVPQSVKRSFQAGDQIFQQLLEKSNACANAGASLIVWPETMVQAILDQRVLMLLDTSHSYKVFDRLLSDHAKDTAFILAGAYGGTLRINPDDTVDLASRYNSAFLYGPQGHQMPKQYNKIHLVPFGEVVPFKKTFPGLYEVLMKFTPYNYDYSLDYGTEYTVFEVANVPPDPSRTYKFGVMICYEDTVPVIAAKLALGPDKNKRLHWLVNISNDGWFVRFDNGKIKPATELAQHTAVCVFRAVENRLAVLRSVNTGISCLIDTVGRIRDGFLAGDLPGRAMERQAVAGWFVDRMPIDKRVTFFSKNGRWLDFACAAAVFLFIIIPQISGKAKQTRAGNE